jgi:hypothetical protein
MLIKIKQKFGLDFFYFLTAVSLLFILAELIWPNIILVYFNINYLVVVWAIFGLLLI